MHIMKTAGLSLNAFLGHRFPAGEVCPLYPPWGKDFRHLLPERPASCYTGHLHYSQIRAYLPGPSTVMTVLREPVDRALSAYFYFRGLPRDELLRQKPEAAAVHELPLAEFVRRHPAIAAEAFGDVQTRFLSRGPWPYHPAEKPVPPITRKEAARARDNLARCLVGTHRRFEEFLALLCRERGWPCPDRVPRENSTPARPRVFEIDAELRAWFDEHTAADARLYQLASEQFEERWEKARREGPPSVCDPPRPEYRLTFDQAVPGYGWHERDGSSGEYIGFTESHAWLESPRPPGDGVRVEIDTVSWWPDGLAIPFRLRLNGRDVDLVPHRIAGGVRYEGEVPDLGEADAVRMDLHVSQTIRPSTLFPGSNDDRKLGIAVRQVRLRGLDRGGEGAS